MADERQPAVRVQAEANGLTVLTLDSPPLNLFDRAMIDDLGVAIRALAEEPPRAVLINADGRAVSAGVDVHMFDGLTPETGAAVWTELLELIAAIAAKHGIAHSGELIGITAGLPDQELGTNLFEVHRVP